MERPSNHHFLAMWLSTVHFTSLSPEFPICKHEDSTTHPAGVCWAFFRVTHVQVPSSVPGTPRESSAIGCSFLWAHTLQPEGSIRPSQGPFHSEAAQHWRVGTGEVPHWPLASGSPVPGEAQVLWEPATAWQEAPKCPSLVILLAALCSSWPGVLPILQLTSLQPELNPFLPCLPTDLTLYPAMLIQPPESLSIFHLLFVHTATTHVQAAISSYLDRSPNTLDMDIPLYLCFYWSLWLECPYPPLLPSLPNKLQLVIQPQLKFHLFSEACAWRGPLK